MWRRRQKKKLCQKVVIYRTMPIPIREKWNLVPVLCWPPWSVVRWLWRPVFSLFFWYCFLQNLKQKWGSQQDFLHRSRGRGQEEGGEGDHQFSAGKARQMAARCKKSDWLEHPSLWESSEFRPVWVLLLFRIEVSNQAFEVRENLWQSNKTRSSVFNFHNNQRVCCLLRYISR